MPEFKVTVEERRPERSEEGALRGCDSPPPSPKLRGCDATPPESPARLESGDGELSPLSD